ncbi:MAG: SHOCT domain-containing protein [Proteobacteria bacterium]|nr:SHOCT domain-containing protein [Pseudomonadota bacterium]
MQPNEESISLFQRGLFGGSQIFTIDSFDSVVVRTRKLHKKQDYRVPIHILNPTPYRFKNTDFPSLFAFIGFAAFASFITWGAFNTKTQYDFYGLMGMALSLHLVAFICLSMFFNKSRDCYIFTSKYSGQTALLMWTNKPNERIFNSFVEELSKRAGFVDSFEISAGNKSLSDEIAKLNELKKAGILSQDEFENAKQRILNTLKAQAKS